MNRQHTAARIGLYIVALGSIVTGLIYILSPRIMPYHEVYLGMPHERLSPKVARLFLAFMKGGGAAYVSLGFLLTMVIRIPFRRGERWAWWAILVAGLGALLPLLVITVQLGWFTPWPVVVLLVLILLVALAASWPEAQEGKTTKQ